MDKVEEIGKARILLYWLHKIIAGFFVLFFIFYIGKFGISNLILSPDNKWRMIFNIGIWYVAVMYLIDKSVERLKNE